MKIHIGPLRQDSKETVETVARCSQTKSFYLRVKPILNRFENDVPSIWCEKAIVHILYMEVYAWDVKYPALYLLI